LLVEFEKFGEVEELTLRSLRPQVALGAGTGSDGCLEHQIEGNGEVEVTASRGVLDVVFCHELAKFFSVVVVNLGRD